MFKIFIKVFYWSGDEVEYLKLVSEKENIHNKEVFFGGPTQQQNEHCSTVRRHEAKGQG